MFNRKRTLFIGAHPDDVFIGAGITIRRDREFSYALTVSNGAIASEQYPLMRGGENFATPDKYAGKRLLEDSEALSRLGLDVEKRYFNLFLPDQESHLHIPAIVKSINKLITDNSIEEIVTHEFPQSHPDHEIVSFCSHYAGGVNGITVWEYPMYAFDSDGKERIREFIEDRRGEEMETAFSEEETRLKKTLMGVYKTQPFIRRMFMEKSEKFRRLKRKFTNIPETRYFYGRSNSSPQPSDIRRAISEFKDKHI